MNTRSKAVEQALGWVAAKIGREEGILDDIDLKKGQKKKIELLNQICERDHRVNISRVTSILLPQISTLLSPSLYVRSADYGAAIRRRGSPD